jgi:hypothetical protein
MMKRRKELWSQKDLHQHQININATLVWILQ